VRVDVAFTPDEAKTAIVGIVVDVVRATSTIVQALDSGYRRVLCCAEVEEAFALREELGEGALAGERLADTVPGFDFGNSPRDMLEPTAETLILTTTNGTRAVVAAASRCETVLVGSLLNLDVVVAAATANARGEDVVVLCAGVEGRRSEDDVYCAGRIAERLRTDLSEAAEEAIAVARSFPSAHDALSASINPRQAGLTEDVAWCARENVCTVAPRVSGIHGVAAVVTAL
jgi:2-phosphosulfolactate phosphatase